MRCAIGAAPMKNSRFSEEPMLNACARRWPRSNPFGLGPKPLVALFKIGSSARSVATPHSKLGRRARWSGATAPCWSTRLGAAPAAAGTRRAPPGSRHVSRSQGDAIVAGDRRFFSALTSAITAASGDAFRIVAFSVQVDHVHAIVEADDKRALSLGVAGFRIRSAQSVNRVLGRSGPVWSGKYHARDLRTPRETRTAFVYVLQNWRKHGARADALDPCSSGLWFDGWLHEQPKPAIPNPVQPARTWLAARGWRERGGGPIAPCERPA